MQYGLTVTTAPTSEPVTLAEAKNHLLVASSTTDDDVYITSLIAMARRYVEQKTKLRLITQTLTMTMDDFPRCGDRIIHFPVGPVQSISSISYYDENGASQTLSSSLYETDVASRYARIGEVDGESWPDTKNKLNAVSVVFVAGFGAASAVPQDLKGAMLLLIGHWFENRESVVVGTVTAKVPETTDALLSMHTLEYYA